MHDGDRPPDNGLRDDGRAKATISQSRAAYSLRVSRRDEVAAALKQIIRLAPSDRMILPIS
jgi:hypothetical protein